MKKYIWGFPGLGKSSLKLPGVNVVDADCQLFEFKNVAKEDLHTDRPHFYERDEAYPRNYLDFIQSVDADIVLLNCHIGLLESLNKENLLLIYPSEQLLPEYVQRYIERGDNPSFVSYMEAEAPGMINYIESTDYDKYKVQTSNTYLSDLFERNDFKMKVMTRKELIEQLQRAMDLKVIDTVFDGDKKSLVCDLAFVNEKVPERRINSPEVWAAAVLDGEYELDIDQLQKVCSQREAEIEKERIFTERRGGLSREELEDKIMQGIVNGALNIYYGTVAPYSHGYNVKFVNPKDGSAKSFNCYCGFWDIPKEIVNRIESDNSKFPVADFLVDVDECEKNKITSFTPEKDTNLERWGSRGYGSRGSIADVHDVRIGRGLDGIVKHHYHGDYASMTPSNQNDLVEKLVYLNGFCLDYLHGAGYGMGRTDTVNIVEYLKKHGIDVSTPDKLGEWIKQNPEKCAKEENRVVRQQFNEGHKLYAQAFCDFVELKSVVNNFKGSFDELCNELVGDRYDNNTFRLEYGVLALSIGRDLGNEIFLCDNAIGIWDEAREEFMDDCVSFKHIKETCREIGFDIKELEAKALAKNKPSLAEMISSAQGTVKCAGKNGSVVKNKEAGEDR